MKATIIIPTYQQRRTLAQAVESALAQDHPDLEVVVCDDASEDGSLETLSKFADDPRLRIFRNPRNVGRVANYRLGLFERASGDFVLNLDGDDYLAASDYVSRAMSLVAQDDGLVLVFANAAALVEGQDRPERMTRNEMLSEGVIDGQALFLRLASERIALYHPTCLYDRRRALDLDFYRADILSSDWESIHRLILHGRVGFIDTVAAVWRRHPQSATVQADLEARAANLERVLGPYRYAASLGCFRRRELRAWLRKALFREAKNTLRRAGDSDPRRARAYLAQVLRRSPVAGAKLLTKRKLRRALLAAPGKRAVPLDSAR